MIGHPVGGYCLAGQAAGFSHAFRVAVTAPGHGGRRGGVPLRLRPAYAGQGFDDRTFLKLLYLEVTMPLLAG